MKLAELFDSKVEKIKFDKGPEQWVGSFEINEIPFMMFIAKDVLPDDMGEPKPHKIGYEVAFGVDNFKLKKIIQKSTNPALQKMKSNSWADTHGILGTGNQGKVFTTVLAGIQEFVKSVKPEFIFFSADEPSRVKLYRRMSKTIGKKIGMKLVHDKSGEFILQKV